VPQDGTKKDPTENRRRSRFLGLGISSKQKLEHHKNDNLIPKKTERPEKPEKLSQPPQPLPGLKQQINDTVAKTSSQNGLNPNEAGATV
jgi:hypothetical protein